MLCRRAGLNKGVKLLKPKQRITNGFHRRDFHIVENDFLAVFALSKFLLRLHLDEKAVGSLSLSGQISPV